MKRVSSTVASALLCNIAFAAPDLTVFGFKFGEKVVLDECPFKMVGNSKTYMTQSRTVDCLIPDMSQDDKGPKGATLYFAWSDIPGMVNMNPGTMILLLSEDGKLMSVFFTTYGLENQDSNFENLKAKYGKPSRVRTTTEQNAFAVKYAVLHAEWELPGLIVHLEGAVGDINTGVIMIDTPAAIQFQSERAEHLEDNSRKL